MNVKKIIAVILLGLVAGLSVACSGGGPTPTRTPKAVAENGNATQTPWIIYVPVTVTPEPFTVTPLPTVTSSQPQPPPPKPTNTRVPNTAAPARSTATPAPPTASAQPAAPQPTATQPAACGQTYQVTQLTFPKEGDTRDAKPGSGAKSTIQFKFGPISLNDLDPKIGYHIIITAPKNSAEVYISHNGYLNVMKDTGAILSQQATYGLTGGGDVLVRWNVTVVYSNAGFDDHTFTALGPTTTCGPVSPTSSIYLRVLE